MAPQRRRILIVALVIAFLVFVALGLYIELKGRINGELLDIPPAYSAGTGARPSGRGPTAAHVLEKGSAP